MLDLGPDGRVAANPSRVAARGLPVTAAVTALVAPGATCGTVELGGIAVRLLTVPVGPAAEPVGYVQAGFRPDPPTTASHGALR